MLAVYSNHPAKINPVLWNFGSQVLSWKSHSDTAFEYCSQFFLIDNQSNAKQCRVPVFYGCILCYAKASTGWLSHVSYPGYYRLGCRNESGTAASICDSWIFQDKTRSRSKLNLSEFVKPIILKSSHRSQLSLPFQISFPYNHHYFARTHICHLSPVTSVSQWPLTIPQSTQKSKTEESDAKLLSKRPKENPLQGWHLRNVWKC